MNDNPSSTDRGDETAATASPRIALWNAYHDMPEVLCIETEDDWREIRLSDLIALIREALGDYEPA